MNTEISFPRHLWQPVCWYLAEVQWGPSHAGAGEVEHPWERQVTLAEMVVDFELATGVKIVPVAAASEADVAWARKCQNSRSMIKHKDKICGFTRASLSSWAPFSKKVRTLSPSMKSLPWLVLTWQDEIGIVGSSFRRSDFQNLVAKHPPFPLFSSR